MEKFCFSVKTVDGRYYSVWKRGIDEADARQKLIEEVGEKFGRTARLTNRF